MQDRIPTKPGRVAVYDEDGNFLRYEIHVRADEPTQEGDPLNKENLLADLTCDVLNIPRTSVPDDAFLNLALGTYKYVYVVTAKASTGRILSGITIKGIVNRFGQSAVTDSNGVVVGFSNSSSVTLTFTSDFIDLKSKTKRVTNTGVLTQVDFIVSAVVEDTVITLDKSQSVRFSAPVNVDIHLVGGGHNGGDRHYDSHGNARPGSGGNSGKQSYYLNVPINTSSHSAIVAGIAGESSFVGESSSSGTYQLGGAPQGFIYIEPGKNGENCTTKLFGTGAIVAGGSGGAGGEDYYALHQPGGTGGTPFGGNGGGGQGQEGNQHFPAQNAKGYGGGGGGAGTVGGNSGGKGYQGAIFLRWRYQ